MKPALHPTPYFAALFAGGLLALTGCDLFEPARRNLTVSLVTESGSPVAQLHATAGTTRVVLLANGGGQRSRDVVAPREALLRVRVTLLDAATDTLADLVFDQEFAGRDGDHWIAARVGSLRPVGHCIGGLAVAPLATGSDSLFVTYGSIPRDAIC